MRFEEINIYPIPLLIFQKQVMRLSIYFLGPLGITLLPLNKCAIGIVIFYLNLFEVKSILSCYDHNFHEGSKLLV